MANLSSRATRILTRDVRGATKFEGMDDLFDNLGRVIDGISGFEAKEVFTHAALVARDKIRELAPIGPPTDKAPGSLRRSIFAARGDMNQPNALVGVNYKIAPHAHLVEFGHAGPRPAPAHPYFRPGLIQSASQMGAIIKEGLLRVIENALQRKS